MLKVFNKQLLSALVKVVAQSPTSCQLYEASGPTWESRREVPDVPSTGVVNGSVSGRVIRVLSNHPLSVR